MSLNKLLTRLILLCVGPLILLAIFLSISSVISKQAERDGQAQSLAKSVATTIDQHLQARISALHMLSESGLVDDPSRWKELYTEAQGFYQGFRSHVILADPAMHMLFNTRAPFGSELPMLPRPKGYAAAPAALETGEPAVGDIFFGPIAREPLVAIAVPAQRQGKPTFLLLTIFETRQFQKYIDQVDLPPRWAMAILDGKGEAIARRAPASPLFAKNADTYRSIIIKSSVAKWSVALERPRDIYSLDVIVTVVALVVAILAITLVSLLGGILISRRLGKAIASLAETPSPGASLPDIAEIASVRRLLDDSAVRRIHSEAKLQESEARYRRIIDTASEGIAMTDADNRISFVNKRMQEMTGFTEMELLGRSILDMVFPEDVQNHRDKMKKRHQGMSEIFERRFRRKNGEELWTIESASPILDDNDRFQGSFAMFTDITERKEAEQELEAERHSLERRVVERTAELAKANSQLKDLYNGAPCGYHSLDADGIIVHINDTELNWVGYRREEVVGKMKFADWLTPKSLEVFGVNFPVFMERGYIHNLEFDMIRRDGTILPVLVSGTAVRDEAGHYIMSRSTLIDYTNQKKAAVELREVNIRLQELDRLKSMFIASMSHELRTPLNSIIGFTGIILMGMSGEISAIQRKQLGMVKNSANHLLELINDVIDVSKIEAGKTDLNIEAFDLSDLTLEVKESFAVAALGRGLELSMQSEGTVQVTSDRRRVKQILVNLVGNAVKFTETGTISILLAQKSAGVEIRVRDTGIGMYREDMERLFEAFSRIHIQGAPIVEGTGLGLYLSRRLAALLSGEITAESEPGRGSEFTLSLPWKYREEQE